MEDSCVRGTDRLGAAGLRSFVCFCEVSGCTEAKLGNIWAHTVLLHLYLGLLGSWCLSTKNSGFPLLPNKRSSGFPQRPKERDLLIWTCCLNYRGTGTGWMVD